MLRSKLKYAFLLIALSGQIYAQSEAGAIFLLIAPGARAGGMGEAHTAVADDAYASYWNPAGLGFLEGTELAFMHVNWLPNLADDLYYDFFAFRKNFKRLGTVGGHLIYLNLGEQIRMGESPDDYLGKFTSYMLATSLSYSSKISPTSSFGLNVKLSYQHLVELGAGAEKGKGTSFDFGFDLGYLKKEFITPRLDIGFTITNIGPKVSFIDVAQADPQPTNFALGLNYALIKSEHNKFNLIYDVNKLLVSSYPDMDWDGDYKIGGFDENGKEGGSNTDYNKKGKLEIAHTDPVYIAIFTSWFDDWLMGGDIDMAPPGNSPDKTIGGYDWDDLDEDGVMDDGEAIATDFEPGSDGWGKYNEYLQKEVGNADDRTISDELDKLVHNFGVEYWYSHYFALRAGYIKDITGKINNPTFGLGLRYGGWGFDLGYTSGPVGHPLTNTVRVSLNWAF